MSGFNNRHFDWRDTFGPGVGRGEDRFYGEHLKLASGQGNRTIRLNSKTFTDTNATSGSIIGFQSKPGIGVASTGTIVGCEISPRASDGIAVANITGAHIDAYLKGTTGNLSGNVRGIELELVTDDAGTRTIAGYVAGIRMRSAFSGTITGKFSAFRIEKPETQTNSNDYDALFQLTGASAAWPAAGTVSNQAGAILVEMDGGTVYIPLYSTLS